MSTATIENTPERKQLIQPPAPGIYEEVPFEEYASWDACNAGALEDLLITPAFCNARRTGEAEQVETKALRQGKAIHVALLEPDRFTRECRQRPPGNGNDKDVRRARLEMEAQGFTLLDEETYLLCTELQKSVARCTGLRSLLERSDMAEVSVVGDVVVEGIPVRCKVRPDTVASAARIVIDLKSCASAAPEDFAKQIYDYGWHRRAAFYLDVMQAAGVDADIYVFAALEKRRPFQVATYALASEAVKYGREKYRPLLRQFGECQRRNEWPSYPSEIRTIDLPTWVYARG